MFDGRTTIQKLRVPSREGGNVSVTDVTSRLVMTNQVDARGNHQVNVAQLQSGTYFIKVASDKAAHTQKLVVAH